MYLDKNNLHGKTMPHIFSVDFLGFEWDKKSKFTENFIKKNDNIDIWYFMETDSKYPEHLGLPHKLPFLPEKMKINKQEKLTCNLNDKESCVVPIRNLKQALKYAINLEKVHSD